MYSLGFNSFYPLYAHFSLGNSNGDSCKNKMFAATSVNHTETPVSKKS